MKVESRLVLDNVTCLTALIEVGTGVMKELMDGGTLPSNMSEGSVGKEMMGSIMLEKLNLLEDDDNEVV